MNQSNAKRLMDEYPGVFVENKTSQVTLNGPPKEMKRCCEKVLAKMPSEEQSAGPSAAPKMAPIVMDKTRQRRSSARRARL